MGGNGETSQSVWIQDQHQCGVPFRLMLIEEKVENFYGDLKKHSEESEVYLLMPVLAGFISSGLKPDFTT